MLPYMVYGYKVNAQSAHSTERESVNAAYFGLAFRQIRSVKSVAFP